MARAGIADETAAVRELCVGLGLGDVSPSLLKAAHHSSFLLPSLGMVARVQSADPPDVAWPRAVRELAVARHLAERGAPVLAPIEPRLAGPHLAGRCIATLWPYMADARAADEPDAALAAATLASIHRDLTGYGELPSYTASLDRCRDALHGDGLSASLSASDRRLLETELLRLRSEIAAKAGAPVPLHGDAHPGNLLIGPQGALWIDFEDACLGPREMDIASLPRRVWSRFGEADRALVRLCAELRSVCVAIWCWADVARSREVREAAEHHLRRVRRLAGRAPGPPIAAADAIGRAMG